MKDASSHLSGQLLEDSAFPSASLDSDTASAGALESTRMNNVAVRAIILSIPMY